MYENVTYETILGRMLGRVSDGCDKREGSIIWDAQSPAAAELQILYIELDAILREAYGDTASREYLIKRAAEKGIAPYPATSAVLKGEFKPESADVSGKRFSGLGSMNYVVLDALPEGGYRVQCETPGAEGNRYLGQLVPIEYVEGLETAELKEVLVPGEDEEDTEDLRARYFESFDAMAFGGNVRDYVEKTNAIPGVGSTKVTRVWNGGIRPADMIPNDAVKAWYGTAVGAAAPDVKGWLEAVYDAALNKRLTVGGTVLLTVLDSEYGIPSDELVRTVQTAIDPEQNAGEGRGLAPIGHVVTVRKAVEVKVTVKTTVTFAEECSWGNLQASIDEAVRSYLLELRKAWADASYLIVRVSQVETRILSVAGVVDVTDTRLNGSADNLTLGEYEVPTYGGAGA